MRSSEASLNGLLPSNACRMMPSSKSPIDVSWYSARALSTFTMRFSSRTPVCIRSTCFAISISSFCYIGTFVHKYDEKVAPEERNRGEEVTGRADLLRYHQQPARYVRPGLQAYDV